MLCKSYFFAINMQEPFRVEGFTSMIRATRSRSSRPNHMHSHFGDPRVARPVNLRRGPRDLHGVAKRITFRTSFGTLFGSFSDPKTTPKSMKIASFSSICV